MDSERTRGRELISRANSEIKASVIVPMVISFISGSLVTLTSQGSLLAAFFFAISAAGLIAGVSVSVDRLRLLVTSAHFMGLKNEQ